MSQVLFNNTVNYYDDVGHSMEVTR